MLKDCQLSVKQNSFIRDLFINITKHLKILKVKCLKHNKISEIYKLHRKTEKINI